MDLDGYLRVSQVKGREGDSFLSPDLQRQQIEGWARLHSHTIVLWATDLDQSGGKMDRPAFVATMERIKQGQTQGIVVAKLDRFSRSLRGALDAIEFLKEHDAVLVSVSDNLDSSTPTGRLMRDFLLRLAEFELDRYKDNWRAALTNVIERGIQPTVAPFGYRKNSDKRFVPDPAEAPHVKEIYSRRINGQTWASIARWLNHEGIKPRQSERWNGNTVKQLTRREVYTGVVSKGDLRKEGAHEALISQADFIAVRGVFAKSGDSPSDTRHVLGGIIRCAGCSRLMSGRAQWRYGKEKIEVYSCSVHHTAGKCPAPANVNESMILPYVEDQFFAYVGDISAESRVDSVELTQAVADLKAAEVALTEYRDDVSLQELLGMESFKEGLRSRQIAVHAASEALQAAKRTASGTELPPAESLNAMWPTLRADERQRLLASAIDVVYVRRSGSGPKKITDRCKIVWRGENGHGLSGPGLSVPIRTFNW